MWSSFLNIFYNTSTGSLRTRPVQHLDCPVIHSKYLEMESGEKHIIDDINSESVAEWLSQVSCVKHVKQG